MPDPAILNFDANVLARRLVTMRGIYNYHPRHRIRLEFVMADRGRFPFSIVEAKLPLRDVAFRPASERSVMRAAIVP
jgi:hypothetical protein